MQLHKLLQIRDLLKCIELIPYYVIFQDAMKAIEPSLDYGNFFISKERSLKLEVKPPV